MKLKLGAAVASFVLASAAAAAAHDGANAAAKVGDFFNEFCVATDGRPALAAAAAKKAGWFTAPEQRLARYRSQQWDTTLGFVDTDPKLGRSDYTLALVSEQRGRKLDDGLVVDLAFCGVTTEKTDVQALDARLVELLGPGRRNAKGAHVWPFSKSDGRLVEEVGFYGASQAEISEIWSKRSTYMVILSQTGEGAALVMTASRRPE